MSENNIVVKDICYGKTKKTLIPVKSINLLSYNRTKSYSSNIDNKIFLYKILFLYNCFLDGWKIEIINSKVKLKRDISLYNNIYKNFNIDKFIINNYLY
jgi:hypothetical protein